MNELNVILMKIEDVKPYDNNPRINDKAVDAVAASLTEFGFRQPIVVDSDNIIVCGHTRYKAAQQLNLKRIPVHVATDLSPEQIRAYRIADNKSAELADWDYEILPIELAALADSGFDMNILAFSERELVKLLEGDITYGNTDPDDVPEPPDEAVTKRDDIWQLGEHRLMCGDSANPEDVARLLDGAVIDIVFTDPPYGVAVQPRSNNAIAAGKSDFKKTGKASGKLKAKDRQIENDAVTGQEFDKLLAGWFSSITSFLKPGGIFYVCGGYANFANYPKAFVDAGLYNSQVIVWDKQHPVIGRKDFMGAYELIYYGWREGAGHKYFGPHNATDLWAIKKPSSKESVHLTQKPTELIVRALQYSSKPKQNVLDLFGGSGSTLIACEQTKRKGYLMELDPLYSDVIVKRWEEFAGREAILIKQKKA